MFASGAGVAPDDFADEVLDTDMLEELFAAKKRPKKVRPAPLEGGLVQICVGKKGKKNAKCGRCSPKWSRKRMKFMPGCCPKLPIPESRKNVP